MAKHTKNDKDQKTGSKLKFIYEFIRKGLTLKYYVIAIVCFLFVCFQCNVRNIILKYVLPNFEFYNEWGIWALTIFLVICCSYIFILGIKNKYNYSDGLIAFLLFLGGTISYYIYYIYTHEHINCEYSIFIPVYKNIKYINVVIFHYRYSEYLAFVSMHKNIICAWILGGFSILFGGVGIYYRYNLYKNRLEGDNIKNNRLESDRSKKNRSKKNPLKKEEDSNVSGNFEFVTDEPIEDPDDDKLDYNNKAAYIVKKIESLPYSKSTSIAIYSSWGNGKTSFMNLIQNILEPKKEKEDEKKKDEKEKDEKKDEKEKEYEKKTEYEIIEFSPRQCKNANSIQEEFFNTLVNSLKKYDSSIAFQVDKYISTIGITVSNPIFRIMYLFLKMDNKELRGKINDILIKLEKRVVIFIDDLDRLTGEEIMEVLKLIDKNAAFSNIVFITAFEPGFVGNAISKYIGENNNDTPFINKFFSIRYPLPIFPSSFMIDKFKELWKESIEKLYSDLKENVEKTNDNSNTFDEIENIFDELYNIENKSDELYNIKNKSDELYNIENRYEESGIFEGIKDIYKIDNKNKFNDSIAKLKEQLDKLVNNKESKIDAKNLLYKIEKFKDLTDVLDDDQVKAIFGSYLHNIRDVKNFYNQFIADYTPEVANQVVFQDFLLVELIKFRNYDEYLSLSRYKYIEVKDNNLIYVLKVDNKDNTKMPKSIDILSILFPDKYISKKPMYSSIQNKHFFDSYFTLSIPERIPVSELDNLFKIKPKDILEKIDTWNRSKILADVYYYLGLISYKDMESDTFKQYGRILFLYYDFLNGEGTNCNPSIKDETKILLNSIFQYKNNGFTEQEHKDYLLEVLYGKENDNDYQCPINVLNYLTDNLFNESAKDHKEITNNCILKKEDIEKRNLLLYYQYKKNKQYPDITNKLYHLCLKQFPNREDAINNIYKEVEFSNIEKEWENILKYIKSEYNGTYKEYKETLKENAKMPKGWNPQ